MESKRWLKMAGLLNEVVDPGEQVLAESNEKTPAKLDEAKIRRVVRKQIRCILNEDAREYTVKKGDFMSKIAKVAGLTLQQLIDANPQVEDPNLIQPGEKLTIPDSVDIVASALQARGIKVDDKVRARLQAKKSELDRKVAMQAGLLGLDLEDTEVDLGPLLADLDLDAPASDSDSDRSKEMPVMKISIDDSSDKEVVDAALAWTRGEEKMSNPDFIAFMDRLGMPLKAADIKKLNDGDGAVAIGDLHPSDASDIDKMAKDLLQNSK